MTWRGQSRAIHLERSSCANCYRYTAACVVVIKGPSIQCFNMAHAKVRSRLGRPRCRQLASHPIFEFYPVWKLFLIVRVEYHIQVPISLPPVFLRPNGNNRNKSKV
ncbi:hypothetical protein PILCRDRAFT_810990 [Piloderma croceum F 1598]|uniref:Uncharacterized protein n=1 Tax=Piloderma croceum (strain F 1598) TaxID=765440 RepID=A0A0C3GMH2_PILCF|nr:hypothetical protein PILCRDRAFT_810990 [Piloderma croceum F 1598]